MDGTSGFKVAPHIEALYTDSKSKLIDEDQKKIKTASDQSPDKDEAPTKKVDDSNQQISNSGDASPPQSPTDSETPTCGALVGGITARLVVWYIAIFLLFSVAFLALVLSVIYFINDSSTEQVVKLYGITGASCLAVITFLIVFLDCCYDGRLTDYEEERVYKVLLEKESLRERQIRRRKRRKMLMMMKKRAKELQLNSQNAHLPGFASVPYPRPHAHPYTHSHPHSHHHHVHYLQPTRAYNAQFFCPICHKSHASTETRHNVADIAVDTSDKFQPISKGKRSVVPTVTTEVQTAPVVVDVENGTQTNRAEATQTAGKELSGIPSNVTEIIHETTILKAPRSLIATLKKTMEEQDKQRAINSAVTDSHDATVETV